jgi:phosphonate transport system substrate-binding protein
MHALTSLIGLLALAVALAGPAVAQTSLHLVLTPSQKPTDLLATGRGVRRVLGSLAGVPVRVTVASDYAAVIEALRNRTADLAFVPPGGYVLASREAKATIVVRNLWHGKSSFTSRHLRAQGLGHQVVEELRGRTIAFVDPASRRATSTDGAAHPEGPREEPRPQDRSSRRSCLGRHDASMRALLNGHVDAIASFDLAASNT